MLLRWLRWRAYRVVNHGASRTDRLDGGASSEGAMAYTSYRLSEARRGAALSRSAAPASGERQSEEARDTRTCAHAPPQQPRARHADVRKGRPCGGPRAPVSVARGGARRPRAVPSPFGGDTRAIFSYCFCRDAFSKKFRGRTPCVPRPVGLGQATRVRARTPQPVRVGGAPRPRPTGGRRLLQDPIERRCMRVDRGRGPAPTAHRPRTRPRYKPKVARRCAVAPRRPVERLVVVGRVAAPEHAADDQRTRIGRGLDAGRRAGYARRGRAAGCRGVEEAEGCVACPAICGRRLPLVLAVQAVRWLRSCSAGRRLRVRRGHARR